MNTRYQGNFIAKLKAELQSFAMKIGLTLQILKNREDWFDNAEEMFESLEQHLFLEGEVFQVCESAISHSLDTIAKQLETTSIIRKHLKSSSNQAKLENDMASINKVCDSIKVLKMMDSSPSPMESIIDWGNEIYTTVDQYKSANQPASSEEVDKLINLVERLRTEAAANRMFFHPSVEAPMSDCCRETMAKLKAIVMKTSIPGLLVDAEYLRQCSLTDIEDYLSEQAQYVEEALTSLRQDLRFKKDRGLKIPTNDIKIYNARYALIKSFGNVIEEYRMSLPLAMPEGHRLSAAWNAQHKRPIRPLQPAPPTRNTDSLLLNSATLATNKVGRDIKSSQLSPRHFHKNSLSFETVEVKGPELEGEGTDRSAEESPLKLQALPKKDSKYGFLIAPSAQDCQKLEFSDSESNEELEGQPEITAFFNKSVETEDFSGHMSYFEGGSILSMYPGKADTVVLTTEKGGLFQFNMVSKQLEDIDSLAGTDDLMNRQYEDLMRETNSTDSIFDDPSKRIDRVFLDCNGNILFVKQQSLYIYRRSNSMVDALIERLPESKHAVIQLMTNIPYE